MGPVRRRLSGYVAGCRWLPASCDSLAGLRLSATGDGRRRHLERGASGLPSASARPGPHGHCEQRLAARACQVAGSVPGKCPGRRAGPNRARVSACLRSGALGVVPGDALLVDDVPGPSRRPGWPAWPAASAWPAPVRSLRSGVSSRAGRYPAGAGGPWLCRTLVLSGFQAVVVPSGFRTSVQPHRWMTT